MVKGEERIGRQYYSQAHGRSQHRPRAPIAKDVEKQAPAPQYTPCNGQYKICIIIAVIILLAAVLATVLTLTLPKSESKRNSTLRSIPTANTSTPRLRPEWGVGTAAYQIEGAWRKHGRTESIWDRFSHTGKIDNNDTGDVSADQYHRYKEDFQYLTDLKVKYYRFSLSWNRIVPKATAGSPVNKKGLQHYNSVINELLKRNITPVVTLFHWDLPQKLQDKYGGWAGREVVKDFAYFAEVCFREFGDRVKTWATLNEPWTFVLVGYGWGEHAPGVKGQQYAAGHNALLAHAEAAKVYRTKYQPEQGGRLTIALNTDWTEPLTSNPGDILAAQLRLEFYLGWFGDPLYFGDYPASMKERLGSKLPSFTEEEKAALKGSIDFFSLNHYSSMYAFESTRPDVFWEETRHRNGKLIGPQAESTWLFSVPWGLANLLRWVHERYGGPEIWVAESGASEPKESLKEIRDFSKVVEDPYRYNYYKSYIAAMEKAIDDYGIDVRAYIAWSFMDNFEWLDGYAKRFGIIYVDFKTQKRAWKRSAVFLKEHFQKLRGQKKLHTS